MQTAINYTDKTAFFSSDESKWINQIRTLRDEHPNDVVILKEPEQNDGCIYAKFPAAWMKIKAPAKHNLTDEQRHAIAERLNASRNR